MSDRDWRLTRRSVLAWAAASAVAATGVRAAASPAPTLEAREASVRLAPQGYPETAVWAYDGRVPGPVIRCRRGERLARRLVNGLSVPTTVHWHGIRLPNAMDGVPGVTQAPVPPGGSFLYDFAVPDPGTYWYHPHVRSWEQVARGLSGALIVAEDDPPQVDRDEVLVLDDWRLTSEAALDPNFENMHDRSHAGRIGNWITVNGLAEARLPARQGERLRLRLVNAATARIFRLGVRGLSGWVVALDGHALDRPLPLERLALAPAQRADLILDITAGPGEDAFLVSFERDGGYALATFAVADRLRETALPEPAPLEPGTVPPLGDAASARLATLRMEGGAMGSMEAAQLGGETLGIRSLVGRGKAWAFNGRADPPEEPLLTARLGETVRIAIVNETRWPHAMHLHGHHFRETGGAGPPGPLRDTLLVDRGARTEIAFVADNEGDWLFHCHMLAHAVGGMSTWVRITG